MPLSASAVLMLVERARPRRPGSALAGSSPSGGSQVTGGVAGAQARTGGGPLGGVLGVGGQLSEAAVKGQLPFTGLPLWTVALVGLGLLGAGLALRRRSLGTTT